MSGPKTVRQHNSELSGETHFVEEKYVPNYGPPPGVLTIHNCGVSVQNERGTELLGIKFLNMHVKTVMELDLDIDTARALRKALNTMKVLDD